MKAKYTRILLVVLLILGTLFWIYRQITTGPGHGFIDPHVPKYEHDCGTCDFRTYFMAFENGNQATLRHNAWVDLSSFTAAMDRALALPHDDHGVIIHHGLFQSGPGQFEYWPEFEFVGLKSLGNDRWDIVNLGTHHYALDRASGELVASGRTGGWETYKNHMKRKLNSNDPNFAKIQEGSDVRFYLVRFGGRLEELLSQNAEFAPTHIQLSSVAEATTEENNVLFGLHHHVCLAMYDGPLNGSGTLLMDNKKYGSDRFKKKALDVGSPCPYRCATALLPKNGTPVRKSCTTSNSGC